MIYLFEFLFCLLKVGFLNCFTIIVEAVPLSFLKFYLLNETYRLKYIWVLRRITFIIWMLLFIIKITKTICIRGFWIQYIILVLKIKSLTITVNQILKICFKISTFIKFTVVLVHFYVFIAQLDHESTLNKLWITLFLVLFLLVLSFILVCSQFLAPS